ncbi:Zinc finger protein 671 [Microtus ochrogaster]|uniref:Zinc finger protein 671 n=1 Tax=Microtus ochrogaster TaxID=79684 RepID=A0A8J6KYM1_MICOH|nr:Zinc finger protein 671 [Microtus ochrogaster]
MAEAPVNQGQSCVNLEDVCLHFTEEEWNLLRDAQKLLYHNVMLETFSLLLSLGLPISKSFPELCIIVLAGHVLTFRATHLDTVVGAQLSASVAQFRAPRAAVAPALSERS